MVFRWYTRVKPVLQRSVMDNMWLGRYPTKGMFVDQDKMYRETKAIFDELDIDIDPRARVGTLSVSQMQMIEIAKAFSYNAKIVIMDEPTSSLTEKEVNHLFTIIRKLKSAAAVLFISRIKWKKSSSYVMKLPYCATVSGSPPNRWQD